MGDAVLYEVRDHIATLTLNRPERMNSFDDEMLSMWHGYIEEAAHDPEVRVVAVTGAGRGFCSGANVQNLGQGRADQGGPLGRRNHLKHSVHKVARAVARLDKPYIAILNGPAVGAGMDMASMADIRIAADTSRFSMAYVKMGIIPGDGGCYYLPRIVGMSRALDLIWSGRFINAQEALDIGWVSHVFPADRLADEARTIITTYARGPAVALQLAKRLAYLSRDQSVDDALEEAQWAMTVVQLTEDSKEGPLAFREKREPNFQGR